MVRSFQPTWTPAEGHGNYRSVWAGCQKPLHGDLQQRSTGFMPHIMRTYHFVPKQKIAVPTLCIIEDMISFSSGRPVAPIPANFSWIPKNITWNKCPWGLIPKLLQWKISEAITAQEVDTLRKWGLGHACAKRVKPISCQADKSSTQCVGRSSLSTSISDSAGDPAWLVAAQACLFLSYKARNTVMAFMLHAKWELCKSEKRQNTLYMWAGAGWLDSSLSNTYHNQWCKS